MLWSIIGCWKITWTFWTMCYSNRRLLYFWGTSTNLSITWLNQCSRSTYIICFLGTIILNCRWFCSGTVRIIYSCPITSLTWDSSSLSSIISSITWSTSCLISSSTTYTTGTPVTIIPSSSFTRTRPPSWCLPRVCIAWLSITCCSVIRDKLSLSNWTWSSSTCWCRDGIICCVLSASAGSGTSCSLVCCITTIYSTRTNCYSTWKIIFKAIPFFWSFRRDKHHLPLSWCYFFTSLWCHDFFGICIDGCCPAIISTLFDRRSVREKLVIIDSRIYSPCYTENPRSDNIYEFSWRWHREFLPV